MGDALWSLKGNMLFDRAIELGAVYTCPLYRLKSSECEPSRAIRNTPGTSLQ
jgi:hypothetical protein